MSKSSVVTVKGLVLVMIRSSVLLSCSEPVVGGSRRERFALPSKTGPPGRQTVLPARPGSCLGPEFFGFGLVNSLDQCVAKGVHGWSFSLFIDVLRWD